MPLLLFSTSIIRRGLVDRLLPRTRPRFFATVVHPHITTLGGKLPAATAGGVISRSIFGRGRDVVLERMGLRTSKLSTVHSQAYCQTCFTGHAAFQCRLSLAHCLFPSSANTTIARDPPSPDSYGVHTLTAIIHHLSVQQDSTPGHPTVRRSPYLLDRATEPIARQTSS